MTDAAPPAFEFPRIGALLDRLGIRLSKSRDQHFLRNRGHCRRIAELCELTPEHQVLEIGAGLGNLSTELARMAGRVTSVEMDRTFEGWHGELLPHFPNLSILYGDFLRFPMRDLVQRDWPGPTVAAGNLPYQITAPILFRLLQGEVAWQRIVVMVQLEVAERIVAGPRTREASALTYKIAFEYRAHIGMKLGPNEFLPPPRVRSAVVVLEPLETPLVRDAAHKQRLHRVVTGAFQHRRRTLANALVLGEVCRSRPAAEAACAEAGIDPMQRPETLGVEDFVAIEQAIAASGELV